jgi:hypothetical protein
MITLNEGKHGNKSLGHPIVNLLDGLGWRGKENIQGQLRHFTGHLYHPSTPHQDRR